MNKVALLGVCGFNKLCKWKYVRENCVNIKKHNAIKATIKELIENNATVIFPGVNIRYTRYIQENQKKFDDAGITYHIPCKFITNAFANKLSFHSFMTYNGFFGYIPKKYDTIVYPCIIKHKFSVYGKDTHILNSPDNLPKDIDLNDYIINELIPGKSEYVTHIFAKNGKILLESTNKYTFDIPLYIKGVQTRPSLKEKIKIDNNIRCVFERIVEKSDYSGMMCIDYKIVDNLPIIFEINPRLGGSLRGDISQDGLQKFIKLYSETKK